MPSAAALKLDWKCLREPQWYPMRRSRVVLRRACSCDDALAGGGFWGMVSCSSRREVVGTHDTLEEEGVVESFGRVVEFENLARIPCTLYHRLHNVLVLQSGS